MQIPEVSLVADDSSLKIWKHVAGVFRFGKGLLGRSSIALVALLALGFAAILKLHSDALILSVFVIGTVVFLIWYFRVERFSAKYPLESLLEGGEYTAHHQMLLASKGQPTIISTTADASLFGPLTTNPEQIKAEPNS